jgi:ubiquitin carboxyl-terminal hydrolase 36/42
MFTLQVKCAQCLHCSNKFDPFLDLSLEIGNAATLVKALHNFTKAEILDGGEKHYNCQQCNQKVVAKKRFTIDKAPSVLTIHLKRFSPFNPLKKIDKKVDFQTMLNLKPFVSDSEVSN